MTVQFHIDDCMNSHVKLEANDKFLRLYSEFEKLSHHVGASNEKHS